MGENTVSGTKIYKKRGSRARPAAGEGLVSPISLGRTQNVRALGYKLSFMGWDVQPVPVHVRVPDPEMTNDFGGNALKHV